MLSVVKFYMQNEASQVLEALALILQTELENHPDGISEFDLMQLLKAQGYFDFLSTPALPHELFRAHFILFHTLYLLRDSLLEQNIFNLEIEPLAIRLIPYQQGEKHLQHVDHLRTYYLDLSNLEDTSEDDVYDMLASFWNKFNNIENRDAALAELGLQDPVDDKMIKLAYRRLAMEHHPDRGGDNEKLQKLNDSIKILLG